MANKTKNKNKNETLPLSSTQFGAKFLAECEQCLQRKSIINVDDVKARCQSMLVELVPQVQMRLPDQKDIFSGLQALAPSKVLSQLERVPFNNLPFLHIMGQAAATCKEQYRKILFHPWAEEISILLDGIMTQDIEQFWVQVKKFKDAVGNFVYRELAQYALTCLTTPVSNVVVERMFSHVSNIKNKTRNRLKVDMLDAIIRIKTVLLMYDKCCTHFKPTPQMLQKFNAGMYNITETDLAGKAGLSLA